MAADLLVVVSGPMKIEHISYVVLLIQQGWGYKQAQAY